MTTLTPQLAALLGVVPIGKTKVNTPSGRGVEQGVGQVGSINVGGAVVQAAQVFIAGPELEAGLLGENFLRHYDVTIRQNLVEFRVRPS